MFSSLFSFFFFQFGTNDTGFKSFFPFRLVNKIETFFSRDYESSETVHSTLLEMMNTKQSILNQVLKQTKLYYERSLLFYFKKGRYSGIFENYVPIFTLLRISQDRDDICIWKELTFLGQYFKLMKKFSGPLRKIPKNWSGGEPVNFQYQYPAICDVSGTLNLRATSINMII